MDGDSALDGDGALEKAIANKMSTDESFAKAVKEDKPAPIEKDCPREAHAARKTDLGLQGANTNGVTVTKSTAGAPSGNPLVDMFPGLFACCQVEKAAPVQVN